MISGQTGKMNLWDRLRFKADFLAARTQQREMLCFITL
jgi:hypothetical protein